jgi:hypothetical protein
VEGRCAKLLRRYFKFLWQLVFDKCGPDARVIAAGMHAYLYAHVPAPGRLLLLAIVIAAKIEPLT